MMKRRIFAATLLAILLPVLGHSDTPPDAVRVENQKSVVSVTVDYGDGAQKRFPKIPWKNKMTAFDATLWAAKHPRGVALVKQGKGSTTLVTQIDDLKNRGGMKSWIFRVNGKLGNKSCAVFAVQPGDRILWSFERYK